MKHKHAGKFILDARKWALLNQSKMAKSLGMTAQFLGRVESGAVGLPHRFAPKLFKITSSSPRGYINACLRDEKARLENEFLK